MTTDSVRLRIQIDSNDFEFTRSIETKFWFLLDCHELHTIESLKRTLLNRIFFYRQQSHTKSKYQGTFTSIRLSLDEFELPTSETTTILRQNDIIIIHLFTSPKLSNQHHQQQPALSNPQKRKQPETSNNKIAPPVKKKSSIEMSPANHNKQQSGNYTACLIGTSMVKQIDVKRLFTDGTKCFFKSISGGLIKSIISCLTVRELLLANCKTFIITAGSNDIDSNSAEEAISDFKSLVEYLNETHPIAKIIINKLIPRTRTKFSDLLDFESKRIAFNNFLDSISSSKHVIVTQDLFEDAEKLEMMLSDGVHLSPLYGVLPYEAQIKTNILNLKF